MSADNLKNVQHLTVDQRDRSFKSLHERDKTTTPNTEIKFSDFSTSGGIFGEHGFLATLSLSPTKDGISDVDNCSVDAASTPGASKLEGEERSTPNKKHCSQPTDIACDDPQEEQELADETKNSHSLKPSPGVENVVGVSLGKKVFAIDHILHIILAELDFQDLLQLRFTCHQWKVVGAEHLKKFTKISLAYGQLIRDYRFISSSKHDLNRRKEPHFLEELNQVIENSDNFPCTSFFFDRWNPRKSVPSLREFNLSNYGFYITRLELTLKYALDYSSFKECPVGSDIKKLLLEQFPNVKHLTLDIFFPFDWTPAFPYDQEPDFFTKNEIKLSIPQNLALNSVVIKNDVSGKLFDGIVKIAKNLVDISVDEYFNHLFYQPANRIHLLKNLTVAVDSQFIDVLEILVSYGELLQITHLYLDLTYIGACRSLWPRFVNAINKILESSKNSMTHIITHLYSLTVLPGIRIPAMRNKLTICRRKIPQWT